MSLTNNERQILAQLELSFATESDQLDRIERNDRRRRVLAGLAVPIGLVVGLLLVVLGVGLRDSVGTVSATAGYVLVVAAGYGGALGVRRFRATRQIRWTWIRK